MWRRERNGGCCEKTPPGAEDARSHLSWFAYSSKQRGILRVFLPSLFLLSSVSPSALDSLSLRPPSSSSPGSGRGASPLHLSRASSSSANFSISRVRIVNSPPGLGCSPPFHARSVELRRTLFFFIPSFISMANFFFSFLFTGDRIMQSTSGDQKFRHGEKKEKKSVHRVSVTPVCACSLAKMRSPTPKALSLRPPSSRAACSAHAYCALADAASRAARALCSISACDRGQVASFSCNSLFSQINSQIYMGSVL